MAPGLVSKLDFGRGRNQTPCHFMGLTPGFTGSLDTEALRSLKCFTGSA